jgi:preprotein translocase subunit SecF
MALLLVILCIVIYLALLFEWGFSVSAIIANLHDVIIILAFFQRGFSLPVFAVLGYLVNESVVVFDRVRDSFGIYSPVLVARLLVTRLGVSRVQFANTKKVIEGANEEGAAV